MEFRGRKRSARRATPDDLVLKSPVRSCAHGSGACLTPLRDYVEYLRHLGCATSDSLQAPSRDYKLDELWRPQRCRADDARARTSLDNLGSRGDVVIVPVTDNDRDDRRRRVHTDRFEVRERCCFPGGTVAT